MDAVPMSVCGDECGDDVVCDVCSSGWGAARQEGKELRLRRTVAALRAVPLFKKSDFDEQQLRKLALKVKHRTFPDGHQLITQGEIGSTFFLLEEGEVKVLKDGLEVARLHKGAHFGEQALLKVVAQRRTADVVATTEIQVLEMSKEAFTAVAAELGVAMAKEHASRVSSEAHHVMQAAKAEDARREAAAAAAERAFEEERLTKLEVRSVPRSSFRRRPHKHHPQFRRTLLRHVHGSARVCQ